jgi:hypothetical protein
MYYICVGIKYKFETSKCRQGLNSGVFYLSEWPSDSDVTKHLCYWFLVVGVTIRFHADTSAGVYSLNFPGRENYCVSMVTIILRVIHTLY